MDSLYIPKKIHIGFQSRSDTYTKKLAYVIYEDEKGVLRKQTSWDNWRDKSIDVVVLENKPTSNFILNKGVARLGYWGNARAMIRVYDPRDFEFEITVENLMAIMMGSDVLKRDIQTECVYAWYGKELILLDTKSEEYQAAVAHTKKQSQSVSAKDFVIGQTYAQKKDNDTVVYIGRFDCYKWEDATPSHTSIKKIIKKVHNGKKHFFYNNATKQIKAMTPAQLGNATDDVVINVDGLVNRFVSSSEGNPAICKEECSISHNHGYGYTLIEVPIDDDVSQYCSIHNQMYYINKNDKTAGIKNVMNGYCTWYRVDRKKCTIESSYIGQLADKDMLAIDGVSNYNPITQKAVLAFIDKHVKNKPVMPTNRLMSYSPRLSHLIDNIEWTEEQVAEFFREFNVKNDRLNVRYF